MHDTLKTIVDGQAAVLLYRALFFVKKYKADVQYILSTVKLLLSDCSREMSKVVF